MLARTGNVYKVQVFMITLLLCTSVLQFYSTLDSQKNIPRLEKQIGAMPQRQNYCSDFKFI